MLIGWNGAFGSLVWTQNAVTCLCQCNCNPGAGIMLDVAWRQALHCFSWEKTPLVERVSPVCQWQGCDVAPPAHTRGLDVDLISNIQHFNDNLLIKNKKSFSDWILPSKNRQGVQSGRISSGTNMLHSQAITYSYSARGLTKQSNSRPLYSLFRTFKHIAWPLSMARGYPVVIGLLMTHGDHDNCRSTDPSSWQLNKQHLLMKTVWYDWKQMWSESKYSWLPNLGMWFKIHGQIPLLLFPRSRLNLFVQNLRERHFCQQTDQAKFKLNPRAM